MYNSLQILLLSVSPLTTPISGQPAGPSCGHAGLQISTPARGLLPSSLLPSPAHTFLAQSPRPDLHTGAPLLNLVTPLSFFSGKPCTASAAGSSVRVTCVSVEWWCGAGSRRPRSWWMAPWEDRNLPEGGAEPAGDSEPEGPEQEVSNTPGREYVQKLIWGGDGVGGGLRWMSCVTGGPGQWLYGAAWAQGHGRICSQ